MHRVGRPIHLSDGTLVFLTYDNTTLSLWHSPNHVTVNLISNAFIVGTTNPNGIYVGYDSSNVLLVRDASDNLYIFGNNVNTTTATNMTGIGFVKGAGYTWTQKTTLSGTIGIPGGSSMQGIYGHWVNVGATGGFVLAWIQDASGDNRHAVFNCQALLAGAGTLVTGQNNDTAFLGSGVAGSLYDIIDSAQDGFGAAVGIVAMEAGSTSIKVAKWTLSSAGVVTGTTITTLNTGAMSMGNPPHLRVLRIASDLYAVLYPSDVNAGVVKVARFSSTALLTAGAEWYGSTGMAAPSSGAFNWTASVDPAGYKIWAWEQKGNLAPNLTSVMRGGLDLTSGITVINPGVVEDTAIPMTGSGTGILWQSVANPIGASADWFVSETNTNTAKLFGDDTQFSASYAAAISDSIPTTESVSRTLAVARSMSDTIATTQSMATLKSAGVLLVNSITTTEAIARTIAVARALIDSIPTTDALTRTSSRAFALSNSIPFGPDVLAVVINRGRSFVTTLTLSESISRSMNNVRSLIDTIPTTDAILYVWQGLYPSIVGIDMERQDNVQIFIVDRFGTRYGELPGATIKNPKWVLNDTETCELDFINVDPGLVKVLLLQRELQIVWNDVINSETGYPEMMWLMVGAKKGKPGTSTRSCEGLLSWFKSRIVETATLTYNDVDQLDIAWGLLQTAQTGANYDRNVGASYAPSGRHRYREYPRNQHKIIYDALKEFPALEGGFDLSIEVDPTGRRMWTPWYPSKGTYKPQYALEWERNVVDYEINEAGWGVRTKLYEVGASDGVIQFEASYEDAAASGAYGAMVGVETNSGEKDVDWLADKAQKSVEKKKAPIKTVSVTAKNTPVQLFGNIHTGDVVPCRIDDSDNYVNEDLRIKTLEWVDPQTLQLELIEPGTS